MYTYDKLRFEMTTSELLNLADSLGINLETRNGKNKTKIVKQIYNFIYKKDKLLKTDSHKLKNNLEETVIILIKAHKRVDDELSKISGNSITLDKLTEITSPIRDIIKKLNKLLGDGK